MVLGGIVLSIRVERLVLVSRLLMLRRWRCCRILPNRLLSHLPLLPNTWPLNTLPTVFLMTSASF